MIRKLLCLVALTFHSPLFAETYTDVSKVKSISITSASIRVRLSNMSGYESCSTDEGWYAFPVDDLTSDHKYSAILSAKAAGQDIFFQLHGCEGKYSKVNGVYLCENRNCR